MKPWLSIIIPTYNGEDYLPFALQSITAQIDDDIECIAVDDGSSDTTLSILKSYQHKMPIKIFQRKRHGNWAANTNYAFSVVTGEYSCFLHQDDIWLPDRVRIMKELSIEHPDAAILLNPSYYLDADGNVLGLWRCPLPPYTSVIKSELMFEKLLIQNFISIPAPVFKNEIAKRVGGLDETAWYTADWDFWLKIVREGDTVYSSTPLSGFRIHSMSQTLVRSSYLPDFRQQLEGVFERHFRTLDGSESRRKKFRKIGIFSINVNVTLAGLVHKRQSALFKLILEFLILGPIGWHLYFTNSRIWERVTARLKSRLLARYRKTHLAKS